MITIPIHVQHRLVLRILMSAPDRIREPVARRILLAHLVMPLGAVLLRGRRGRAT